MLNIALSTFKSELFTEQCWAHRNLSQFIQSLYIYIQGNLYTRNKTKILLCCYEEMDGTSTNIIYYVQVIANVQ